ncbi:uncharacterized protein LY89DRAFT_369166 [Mollisia scopiformis]|uniref:Uncharacterized protein n=1 Tax=Mollisia scopiformis TaxID=149040 RepID=A0A132B408_MOLSC|nr:uncharacterized protein LY89DRAFT_369166 [Mollisia scopiformis]KUJ07148.1 hypothetical protein LY89DRAFT_369166 [Mollisia scopiformis]
MVKRQPATWLQSNLDEDLKKINVFATRSQIIELVAPLLSDPTWRFRQYQSALDSLEVSTPDDFTSFSKLIGLWANDPLLHTSLMPVLQKLAQNPDQIFEFLYKSLQHPRTLPDAIFLQLVPTIRPLMDPTRQRRAHGISVVLCHMQELGLTEQVREITVEITKAAASTSDTSAREYLPFLRVMVGPLSSRKLLDCLAFRMMYLHILNTYIRSFSKKKPTSNMKRQKCGCGCFPCKDLDKFMESLDRKVLKRYRTDKERKHIRQRVHAFETRGLLRTTVMVPVSLEMIKTSPELEKWDKSCASIVQYISKIGHSSLKVLLGVCYTSIMALEPIPVADAPASVLSQVIDLTDAGAGTPSQPAKNPSPIHRFGVPAFSQIQSSLSGPSRTPESNTSCSETASKRSETRISPPLQATSINKVTALNTLKRIHSPPASPTRVTVPVPATDRVVPQAPPPPAWLTTSVASLSAQFPTHIFADFMQPVSVDIATGQRVSVPSEGHSLLGNTNLTFFPRIACADCHTSHAPGPGQTAETFRIHITSSQHRNRVAARIARAQNETGGQPQDVPVNLEAEPPAKKVRCE